MSEVNKQAPLTTRPAQTSKKDIKAKSVVRNPVKIKKKSKFGEFVDQVFVADFKSVLSWGLSEVIIPSIKKLFVEFVDNTVNSMVYGKGASVDRRRITGTSNVSYREYYSNSRVRDDVYRDRHNEVYSYGTVDVKDEVDARRVLNEMEDFIRTYGFVLVANFFEMISTRENPIHPRSTDYNYGWTSLAGAKYTRLPNGECRISLPRVMEID